MPVTALPGAYSPRLTAPGHTDAVVLDGTLAAEVTVPADARFARFAATGDFYAAYDAVAAVPAASVTDGTAPELNPDFRVVDGVTTISLIAPAAAVVTVSFYS